MARSILASLFVWLKAPAAKPSARRNGARSPRLEGAGGPHPARASPGLGFSTFFGNGTQANAVAVDAAGDSYVTGSVSSAYSFPTLNAFQPHIAGTIDAFVAKFDSAGRLLYSTYLGGSGGEEGMAIAVDAAGDAFVTGQTTSADFPTLDAFQSKSGGGQDAFLTELSPAGGLLYSTYLGGSGTENTGENCTSIAVDSSDDVYLAGRTSSTNFPTTSNALQPVYVPYSTIAYLTKLDTNLSGAGSLVYSTYLNDGPVRGLAVDGSGDAYVASSTAVRKVNPTGSALVYSSAPLAGATIFALAVDGAGDVYLTGSASSIGSGLTTTPSAYQTQAAITEGDAGAFLTELGADGTSLVYSTYLDGTGDQGAASPWTARATSS